MGITKALRAATLLGLCLISGALSAQDGPQPMTLVDFLSLPLITNIDVSPDGNTIVYSESTADWKADGRVSHLWLRNADGRTFLLTNGPSSELNARISPNGRYVAFTAKRGPDKTQQLYVIAVDGGEAKKLTFHPTAVAALYWSPDSESLYFLADDAQQTLKDARKRVRDDMIRFEGDIAQQHLWQVSRSSGEPPARLTSGDFSVRDVDVGRSGNLLISHWPSPLLDNIPQTELSLLAPDSKSLTLLTDNDYPEENARLSPDGRRIAFTARVIKPEGGINVAAGDWYYNPKIYVMPVSGGRPRPVASNFAGSITDIAWTGDGQSLVMRAEVGVSTQLFRVDVNSGTVTALTSGDHRLTDWAYARSAGRHIVIEATDSNPGEVAALDRGRLKPLTSLHGSLAQRFAVPKVEAVSWQGQDGVTVEGLLTYPLDYKGGQRYPLVVQTHGGPAAADLHGNWHYSRYAQVLAAKGYLVLQVNYRGSTGYGDAFLRDMVGGYFRQAHLDVMTGVDAMIARGIADPDKLIKMGWSAGGHMTNKLITFTDRFAAASSGAGAANWISMYGQTDLRFLRAAWFGGTPWQAGAPIDTYWEHSPLKDVHKVKTPTLILVGGDDKRVPPPQSTEMFRALKATGVKTAFYIAPGEPHGWRRLSHRLFKANVELEWFAEHALKKTYSWEQPPYPENKKNRETEDAPTEGKTPPSQ